MIWAVLSIHEHRNSLYEIQTLNCYQMLQCHASSEETAAWRVVIFIVFVQLGEMDTHGENHVSAFDFTNSNNFWPFFLKTLQLNLGNFKMFH